MNRSAAGETETSPVALYCESISAFLRIAEMLYLFVLEAFMRRQMFLSGCKMRE
jgi:hypothetical protein